MIIDPQGKHWNRSEDRSELVCEDGRKVIGNAEMTDEYMLSVAFMEPIPAPIELSDSDRIAELEAQVKALLAKLS
jgi:hypothetical protein